jgi:hypothetical protein
VVEPLARQQRSKPLANAATDSGSDDFRAGAAIEESERATSGTYASSSLGERVTWRLGFDFPDSQRNLALHLTRPHSSYKLFQFTDLPRIDPRRLNLAHHRSSLP